MSSASSSPSPSVELWIDGHLDLAWIGLVRGDLSRPTPEDSAVSWPSLDAAGIRLVLGTIFTEMDGPSKDPASYPAGDVEAASAAGRLQLEWYRSEERAGRLRIVHHLEELAFDTRPAVVLLMECADPIADANDAAWWVGQGVRVVGLSWARGSRYAGGNATSEGLTPAGRSLVAALDDAGAGHDCSHLSPRAFDELLAATDGPVCATHSNAARLAGPNPRHLEDDQYRAIAARDGIVGLNLFRRFLRPEGEATVEDCLDHLDHAAGLVGRHRVALGSDADGGFGARDLPVGLQRLEDLHTLADGLRARGWSDPEVAGFRYGNWQRWLESLPSVARRHA